ncbi:MAG: sirohydrochlorin chelatase [Tumebacillaceae bacterium]
MTTGILLVAHGSPVPAANRDLLELVPRVRERSGYAIVEPAFLEGAVPSISDGIDSCVSKGATTVVVIPYFLLLGQHVATDIPALIGQAAERHPQVQFRLGRHLADHDGLAEIVLGRMKESGFFATMDV